MITLRPPQPLKKVDRETFLGYFHESVRIPMRAFLEHYTDAVGLVMFENLQMDSSQFGDRTAVPVGPSNSITSVEDVSPTEERRMGKWIHDLPSQRQYPQAWVSREDFLEE